MAINSTNPGNYSEQMPRLFANWASYEAGEAGVGFSVLGYDEIGRAHV